MGKKQPPQHNVFFSDTSESEEELGNSAHRIESKQRQDLFGKTKHINSETLDSATLSSVATSGELDENRMKEFEDFTPELQAEFERLKTLDYQIRTYESNGDYRAIQNLLETEDNKTLINKFRGHPTVEKFVERFDNALIKAATQRPGPG